MSGLLVLLLMSFSGGLALLLWGTGLGLSRVPELLITVSWPGSDIMLCCELCLLPKAPLVLKHLCPRSVFLDSQVDPGRGRKRFCSFPGQWSVEVEVLF